MGDYIYSLTRSETCQDIPRESELGKWVLLSTWTSELKRRHDWDIRKFKAHYSVRGVIRRYFVLVIRYLHKYVG